MKNIVAALLFFVFHTAQAFTPTNTQEITKDQQTAGLDATVTVDHRLLSEGGRNAIKEDFEDTNNHFNHEVLQGTVEGIQAGSVGAVVDAVGRKIDLRHGIVAIQTDENSLTEQQLNAVNGKHSDADSKQQGMQSLSDRLTDQAGVAGQEILLYMNSGDIAGGFHHDQSNSSSVNAAITNMTDGGEIVKVVAHETTHHILNEQNNGYTGNQKEAAATKDGDYAQRLWEQQNTRNGHTTGGSAEDIKNWNTNNQNSELIKTNTDRVAAIPAAERENLGPAIPIVIAVGAMIASDIKVANAPSPTDNLDNTPQSVSLLPTDLAAEALNELTEHKYEMAIGIAAAVGNPKHAIEDGADVLKAVGGKLGKKDGADAVGRAEVSRSRYPEGAQHIEDAQAAGHPSRLTIDRPNAPSNRTAAQAGHQKVPNKDLDEYPPAMFKEGGAGASIRPMTPSQNRGMGACIANQCRGLPDGTKVDIVVVD